MYLLVFGQDLSKITMPVAVNEPLSFLQRMVEYLEYAELLVAASQTDDPVHRLEVRQYTAEDAVITQLYYFFVLFGGDLQVALLLSHKFTIA